MFVQLNVVSLCSYRGYGRSQGQPSEAGIKLDSQAALDYLLQRPDINKDLVNQSLPACLFQANVAVLSLVVISLLLRWCPQGSNLVQGC